MPDTSPLPVTERTRHRRLREQGSTERGDLDAILAAGVICHLGVVVDGDPTVDIRVLQDRNRIHHVFKAGVEVDRSRPWPQRTVFPKERVSQYSQDLLLWEMAHELAGSATPPAPALEPTLVRDEMVAGVTTSCPCSM